MSLKELVTNMSKTPHVHARWEIKDLKFNEKVNNHKTYSMGSFSIESVLEKFKSDWTFVEYNQNYACYKNDGTEYIRFEATLADGYTVTADVFSCYCEPLNEDQDPPF